MDDYKKIDSEISLEAKAADGDEIAQVLMCHLKHEMECLKNKLN